MHIIKTLLKSVREYKKQSIMAPIFILFEVIMECTIPFIVAKFINTLQDFSASSASGNELLSKIVVYGIILVIMAFLSLFCGIMAAKAASKASSGFAKNLRHDLYYKVQEYSFSNIDKFSTPSLVTRMTTDVGNVRHAYMMIIRVAIRSPLLLIFSMVISFSYHSTLPLIFLTVLPILGGGLYFIFIKCHPLFKKVFKKYDTLNNTVQENIRGMRVVKAYVRESYEIDNETLVFVFNMTPHYYETYDIGVTDPGEYVEIEAMVESEVKPELKISDRDIIDANIVYTKYNPANNSQYKDRLYDKLPSVIFKTLRIIYSIIVGLAIIASILAYKTTAMDKNAKIVGVWMIIIMLLGALAFY